MSKRPRLLTRQEVLPSRTAIIKHLQTDVGRARKAAPTLYDSFARLARQLRSAQLPHGMTIERLSTLGTIRANQPVSISALSALESMSQTAISRSVTALEQQGLIRRQADDSDARAVKVWTTAKGNRVFSKALGEYLRHIVEICHSLGPEQRGAIVQLLQGFDPNAASPND